MAQIPDDIFMGNFIQAGGWPPRAMSALNPTEQQGVGPMGRIFYYDIVPATLGTALVAALQAPTSGTALTLTAGTGVTAGTAPDGSGRTVLNLDVARAISLTSAANLSAINFTVTGFDYLGRLMTQVMTGPNANTVNSLKAFFGILSVVPNGTSGSTVSVGTADIIGLPYLCSDAGYITSVNWNNTLARDAGTFTARDATSPATGATGDPRGTYLLSSASNAAKRLVIGQALTAAQCGPTATLVGAIGVTPA